MEIENEIKAKVFAQYWGKTFINGMGGHSALSFTDLTDISLGRIDTKMLLKPLSSITDEDAMAVAEFAFNSTIRKELVEKRKTSIIFKTHWNSSKYQVFMLKGSYICIEKYIADPNKRKDINISIEECNDFFTVQNSLQMFQFLQSKGYDLPQYLLGGKTLQEAGLAIYE